MSLQVDVSRALAIGCASVPTLVRNATTADAELVCEIWNEGLETTGHDCGTHDWHMSMDSAVAWIAWHQQALRPLWLASVDDRPTALLSFVGFSDRPGCHAMCELAVHVRHGQRGKGVGRALLERAISAAPVLGYDRYIAYVRSDNAASAALFRGRGFRPWGYMPGAMQGGGRRYDLLLFGIEV